jgi:hypothetical protein
MEVDTYRTIVDHIDIDTPIYKETDEEFNIAIRDSIEEGWVVKHISIEDGKIYVNLEKFIGTEKSKQYAISY